MKPGIYRDMDSATYFGDPCDEPSLSQSIAKLLIERSPLHARLEHPKLSIVGDLAAKYGITQDVEDEPEKYVKAQAIGNAAHKLLICRGKEIEIIQFDNFRKQDAKDLRDAATAAGRVPILEKHMTHAEQMVAAAWSQLSQIPFCHDAFRMNHGSGEVVAIAQEEGLWLRTMIDWLTPDLAEGWDYKTTGMSASPYAAGKMMASAGWHVQAAMQERILDALDPAGAGRRTFRFVCQENTPPYALTVSEIGESALTIGRKQIDYAVEAWRRCLHSDDWPGYPQQIIRPDLPVWAESSWMDRETAEYEARQSEPIKRGPVLKSLMGG